MKHIRVSRVSVGAGISLSLAMAAHKARVSAAQRVVEKSLIARDAYSGIEMVEKSVCRSTLGAG